MLTGDEHIRPEDRVDDDTAQPLSPRDEPSGAQASDDELHAPNVGGDESPGARALEEDSCAAGSGPSQDSSSTSDAQAEAAAGSPGSHPDQPGHAPRSEAASEAQSAGSQSSGGAEPEQTADGGARPRRQILIGSQRDPAAYRRRQRDWVPVVKPDYEAPESPAEGETPPPTSVAQRPSRESIEQPSGPEPSAVEPAPDADLTAAHAPQEPDSAPVSTTPGEVEPEDASGESAGELMEDAAGFLAGGLPVPGGPPVPLPNLREQLPLELESEFERAMGDAPLDELIDGEEAEAAPLVPETRHQGRIVAVGREDVFVDLGRREQGRLALRQFGEPPQAGAAIEVVVERFNEEDGLYELRMPDTAVEVDDWADLAEGMLVEARVTGHNTGGLECEVNRIRGFIPVSQIALYRVEGLEQFVGERLTCVVSEADRARRNLVLSRRAVLEREQQEARQRLLDSLEPGQVREGVVRKLTDFGAFVDLGGVDGLVHVSRLAWHRVEDPREVLQEGQQIKVKVEKVDRAAGRIGLSYRDMVENPWHRAAEKYQPNSVVQGRVTRLMDFGAFVELEPGVEGLVHISELASRHVWRASDVVSEGQEVEVLILSVDAEAQRISLSMKALEPKPQAAEHEQAAEPPVPPTKPKKRKPGAPLAGGLGRPPGGEQFGLKW